MVNLKVVMNVLKSISVHVSALVCGLMLSINAFSQDSQVMPNANDSKVPSTHDSQAIQSADSNQVPLAQDCQSKAQNNTTQASLSQDKTKDRNCFNNPCYSEFINLVKAEEVYLKVSDFYDQEAVFYSSDVPHAQSLQNSISRLMSRYNANIGFAVFDRNGLAFLKNNRPFPIENMKGFYVCYAAADKVAKDKLPYDYKIKIPLNELKTSRHSSLYEAILKSNFLRGSQDNVAPIDKLINVYDIEDREQIIAKKLEEQKDNVELNLKQFNAFHGLTSDATVEQWLIQGWLNHAENKGIKDIELPIADLIYYGMNEDDELALHLLVSHFLGGKEAIAKFLEEKGIKIERYDLVDHLGKKTSFDSPDGYHFAINNFYNARILSTMINDQSLNIELKDLLLQAMRFAPRSQGWLSEGIKQSIENTDKHQENFASLKIFDLNSFTKGPDQRWTATSLAYIEFLGYPFIISIGVDNIIGEEGKSKEQAQIILKKLGTIIFDHLHIKRCP